MWCYPKALLSASGSFGDACFYGNTVFVQVSQGRMCYGKPVKKHSFSHPLTVELFVVAKSDVSRFTYPKVLASQPLGTLSNPTAFPTPTTSTIWWCAPLFTIVSYIQLRHHYHTDGDKYKYSLSPLLLQAQDSHTAFAVSHPRENEPRVYPHSTQPVVVKFELDVVSCSTSRSSCC